MKAVVIGGVNIDIGGISKAPLILGDSNPGKVTMSLGGVGRNIAHNLRLLDVPVTFLTAFGEDAFASRIEASCAVLGIDISHARIVPDMNSSTYLYISGPDGDMHCAVSDMDICEKKYLEEVAPMEFLGNTYLAPIESEEYLTHQYGNNWRIPSAKFEFNLSKSARLKQLIIMYIKEFIPTPLLEKLQEKKEQPVIDGFLKSIYEKRQGLLK